MELKFAETGGPVFDGLGEQLFGVGLRNVYAVEPDEMFGTGGLHCVYIFEYRAAGKEIGVRDAGAVEMIHIGFDGEAKVVMDIDDGGAPFGGGGLGGEP